jgi:hypothetical protein
MNKTLAEEELDRELILNPSRHSRPDGTIVDHSLTAKIGKKRFSMFEQSNREKKVTFEKRSSGKFGDELEITFRWNDVKLQRCNLGHDHEIEKKEREYRWFHIPWEHVESLIEWLQSGKWNQVALKAPPHVKVLKEVEEFLILVEERDKILKPASQKLRTKVRNVIPWGYEKEPV